MDTMTDSFWSRFSGTKTVTPQQPDIQPEDIAAAKTIAAAQGWEAAYQATGISPGAAVIATSQQAVAEKPTPEFITSLGLGVAQHGSTGEDPRRTADQLQRELAGIRHRLSRALEEVGRTAPAERQHIDDELTRIRDLLK